ncbi:uncharacterized protein LOC115735355 [Rhodamnia argentea]|uniref:Uncharacterized protein LOC115735355 n=1 Tax=Rhodamnia argentea TaxID=178133 RepID=A0A8B8NK07_9MYRT|nr:uncharacterized protein LOC115735355 [Rhodamnia argentea]
MEPLYAKLYDKYTNLKAKKFSALEEVNKEQELKFMNYMTAAEELIQHLRDENEKLHAKIDELAAAAGSNVDESSLENQKLLIEEIQKNKELSEEVARLRKLLDRGPTFIQDQGGNNDKQMHTPEGAQPKSDMPHDSYQSSRRKRRRPSETDRDTSNAARPHTNAQENSQLLGLEKEFHGDIVSCGAGQDAHQPGCCIRTDEKSGGGVSDSSTFECMFQALIQYILGMKFSIGDQTGKFCLVALHESSGYSFSLTWANGASGGDVELMYSVLSLGTYERVAPEWMREVIKFSIGMCPVFFQRISRVIR